MRHAAAHTVALEIERAIVSGLLVAAVLLGLAVLSWGFANFLPPDSRLASVNRVVHASLTFALRPARAVGAVALASALLLAGSYAVASVAARPPASTGPNVLLVVMDTVRKSNLSLYGHHRKTTPNIDRFAQDAVVFDNAFAIGAWTVPNHASMFTGLYASEHGATWESRKLSPAALTLAELLRESGYDTAGFVNNVNIAVKRGFGQGFAHYEDLFRERTRAKYARSDEVPDGDSGAFATGRAVLRWLDDRESSARPFFLFLNYIEAHSPYEPPERFAKEYLERREGLSPHISQYEYVEFLSGAFELTEADFRASEALYDAEIRYLDEQLGALLEALEARGALSNTLVILTSDHGEYFGDHGLVGHQFALYDSLLRVPLIVRLPGKARSGSREQRWAELSDLFPTILETAGVERSGAKGGRSRSLFSAPERTRVVAEYYKPLKYLGLFEETYPDFDRSPFDRRIRALREGRHKFIWSSDGRHELYEMDADPDEARNLAAAQRERVAERERALAAWSEEGAAPIVGAGDSGESELDEEMRAELRALGYVE